MGEYYAVTISVSGIEIFSVKLIKYIGGPMGVLTAPDPAPLRLGIFFLDFFSPAVLLIKKTPCVGEHSGVTTYFDKYHFVH